MVDQECINCKSSFKDYPSNNRKYCSRKCAYTSFQVDHIHKCLWCEESFIDKKINSKFCSPSCAGKRNVRLIKNHRGGAGFGEKHWNWKGGNLRGNRGSGQRRFRKSVLERDNYTCQECGTKNGRLVADHIKSWALYPELREDPNNGRTLCYDCNYESTYIKKEWQVQHG